MSRGVRIFAGRLRGRWLEVPASARPSAGRLREALMSTWQVRLPGARVLDLFAGSGAAGIEAWSRGASQVVLVEQDRSALRVLRANAALATPTEVTVLAGDASSELRRLAERGACFDLVFADPPYAQIEAVELLSAIAPVLADEGELALEHAARLDLPDAVAGLSKRRTRRHGEGALSFFGKE